MYEDYSSDVFDYEISCHDLDENHTSIMQDTYDLDEDYARDSHDYTQLAYMHYASHSRYTSYHNAFEICVYHMTHYILSQHP